MAKKKQAKKKHDCGGECYGPVYIQASNPDQSIFNFIRNLSEEGHTVYFQSGAPTNPPKCPPGGCQ